MKIVVASGKGGTGKTTVAVNLAYLLARSKERVQYVDCDVEEPNGHIFLKPDLGRKEAFEVVVPVVDQGKCNDCGECGRKCQYHAIINLPGNTLVFPPLCHGCGLCMEICPQAAISEGTREIGYVEQGTAIEDIQFVHGVLNIGEPMATPLIGRVKEHCLPSHIQIIDAPPGTSCSVVKTILDCDVVVMVTEPTPFGLHDLTIAVSVARNLGKPVGVVINRSNGSFPPLREYLEKAQLPLFAEIPEDKVIAGEYSRGNIIIERLPEYTREFVELMSNIGKVLRKKDYAA